MATVTELLDQAALAQAGQESLASERELRRLVEFLARRLRCQERSEFDHYGSGYASYVDAWFYRDAPARPGSEQTHTGLAVLLCRLAPCYCLLEGEKKWGPRGGVSYLPRVGSIDVFEDAQVLALAAEAESALEQEGLRRLRREELNSLLPKGARIDTNLSEPPYCVFDALFHWMD